MQPTIEEAIVRRFECYFQHRDPDHDVLKVGDRAAACKNARRALNWLGVSRDSSDDPLLFDENLSAAVTLFQRRLHHRSNDGRIGPRTRVRLVNALLVEFGASRFLELDRSEVTRPPTVFLSYAWGDSDAVDKIDQWLRDRNVSVIRDIDSFVAGDDIKLSIKHSVSVADKVIAIYSKRSKNRDWPSLERQYSEEVERKIRAPILIYLCLDQTPLKKHDPHRIAVRAEGRTLKMIGEDLLKALGVPLERPKRDYDENKPLA